MSDVNENNVIDFPVSEDTDSDEQVMDVIEKIEEAFGEYDDPEMLGLSTLASILELDDKAVGTIGQQLIWEIEKELNKPEIKIAFNQFVEKNNITNVEIDDMMKSITEEISNSDVSEIKQNFLVNFFALIFSKIIESVDEVNQKIIIPTELINGAKLPKYAHEGDGAMDVYALEDYTINPGETKLIPTGIKMAIPQGYGILVQPRSGKSLKSKLRIANTPGLIDSGYRDEIGVIVENIQPNFKDIDYEFDDNGNIIIKSIEHGTSEFIAAGERFAQLRLVKIPQAYLQEVDSVYEIGEDRGGGFGSSGK